MSLLPPNSTLLERNIEAVTKRATDIPVPLRSLWDPNTCPEDLLPWLAWALGVDTWKSYWPLNIRRSMLRTAVANKRRQGTAKSVRSVVQAFGAGVALREGFNNPSGAAPHSFDIVISAATMGGEPITADFQQDIINEVTRAKPARSFFTVSAAVQTSSQIGLVNAARAALYHRLELTEQ